MSRIQTTFARQAAEGRKALIPYVTAGDPYADVTVELMHAMVAAGADVIELGVPFSDPMADGPVIQRASERALLKGISTADVLSMVRAFRQDGTAVTQIIVQQHGSIDQMRGEALGVGGIFGGNGRFI